MLSDTTVAAVIAATTPTPDGEPTVHHVDLHPELPG